MKVENKYIRIVEIPKTGKTKRFYVWNKNGDYVLAEIFWYSNWRQYCVEFFDKMVFNSTCLDLINGFIKSINIEHRKNWSQKKVQS